MTSVIGPNCQVCWLWANAVKSMLLFQLSDVRSVDFLKNVISLSSDKEYISCKSIKEQKI